MIASVATLLAAADKEVPLIDIDGTVLVQFGIFVAMVIVLYTLVFKPYLAMREQREKGIGGAKGEARSMEDKAQATSIELEQKLVAAKQRAEAERLKIRAEAAAHEREVLGAARDAAQRAVSEAKAQARSQQEAARARLTAETQALATQVASRVLGRSL